MKFKELFESRIDNVKGAGVTPNNTDVDYFGLRVLMKPSTFLSLARPLDQKTSVEGLIDYLNAGNKVASPFLEIAYPPEWEDGDFSQPAVVKQHEGRNRMYALTELDGDIPVEVHLFFRGGVRSRDLTPEIINALNKGIVAEAGRGLIKGPLFRTY